MSPSQQKGPPTFTQALYRPLHLHSTRGNQLLLSASPLTTETTTTTGLAVRKPREHCQNSSKILGALVYNRSKMIQDSAQIRRRGAQDFKAYYDYACARQDSVPLPAVNVNLTKGILDLSGDRVKVTDWVPILGSISINKHLHHIAIHSTYQAALNAGDVDSRCYKSSYRKKIPAICCKDTILKLCKALRDCLAVSPSLKTLQLNGLPLRERDLITLTKGLGKSNSLENLSLANCPIGDDGLEVICQSVKYSASIKTVDFMGCNLTWRGAEHMANIIKHQGMRRHGEGWAQSLRYRQPQFEGMAGLRRVTLNCNLLIGDRGAAAIAHELAEDLWVKAVDLQKCGLSNKGAQCLLESLKTNSTLCVLDVRSNPLVDKVLIKTIIEKILMNADGQSSEYNWIKPPTHKESPKPAGPKRRPLSNSARGKAAFRIAPRRGTSAGRWSPGVVQQQRPPCRSRGVPWRTAARSQRQSGLSPGLTMVEQSFQGAASVKVTLESELDEEEEEEEVEEVVVEVEPTPSAVSRRRMQMELEECRMRLAEERRARLKAESRVMEYEMANARLRSVNLSMSEALVAPNYRSVATASSALEDEAVLDSIENSFTKFHAFLDLLKDAGLGQLASIAGIDQSDFSSLGKPQFSSSTGQPLGCDASAPVDDRGFQNIEAETDAAYTVGNPQLAASRDPVASLDHRSPASPRGFLPADKPTELPLSQPSGPAIDPHVDLEGGGQEPDEYSKPEVQHDSGSERSFRSHKSYGSGSHSNKSFLVSSSHGKASKPISLGHSNSNSHHSNGSHGSSFKNHNVYSSIHSDGSLSDLSVRSSVSDIISEKAASVASSGSKGSGIRRRRTAGCSGSEGSEVKAYMGLDTMAQIRSLGSLGGQSDDDRSF